MEVVIMPRGAQLEHRPRLLWVGKAPRNHGASGEEVFDARMIAALARHVCDLDLFQPVPVERKREVANLVLGVPYLRARFATTANIEAVRRMSRSYDAVICSWEAMDALALNLRRPTIFIPHNITSQMLPEIYPGTLARAAAWRARRWEEKWYRPSQFVAIATLSRADLATLSSLPDPPKLFWTPPGMPPCLDLAADARVVPELVLLGAYGWPPKRRDVERFAEEYSHYTQSTPAETHLPVLASSEGPPNGLPPHALARINPKPLPSSAEKQSAIRFGLITDRFQAGHKLKTLAYIAENQIVLSFADIAFDFAHIPDNDLFIRRLHKVEEVTLHVAQVAAMPADDLRQRFIRFKAACAQAFTWDAVAESLLKIVQASLPCHGA